MRRLILAFLAPTLAAGLIYLVAVHVLVAPRAARSAANLAETAELVGRTLSNQPLSKLAKILDSKAVLPSLRAVVVDGRGMIVADSDIGLSEPLPGTFSALARGALADGTSHRLLNADGGQEFLAAARPIELATGENLVLILIRRLPLSSSITGEGIAAILLALLAALLPAWMLARWIYRGWLEPLDRIAQVAADAATTGGALEVPRLGSSQTRLLETSLRRLVTVNRSALEEERKESGRLRKVLDDLPEGVLLVDGEGRPRLANRMFRRLFQSQSGTHDSSLLELTRHPGIARLVRQVLASGTAHRVEIALQIPRAIDLDVECQPTGSGDGAILVAHDTSAERRLNVMRRDFVANVSHELKTPLAALRGYLELLADGALEDPDKGRHFLERMLHQTQRLESLVGDLLTLARLESAASEMEESFDLEELAADAIDAVRPSSEARGVRLHYNGQGPISLRGDKKAIEHLLSNLLMNAIQYSPAGSDVELRLKTSSEEAIIEVEDHGIGISAGDQQRIFERFYRVDPARSREVGGTGLGLAIVKHATQLHRGAIEVHSELERGSTFTVHLPFREENES